MPEVFYVATLVMCLHGECTKFESAPYSRDISIQNCAKIIRKEFQYTRMWLTWETNV